ncbi:MAG: efflux RND transporter periplasmic adaptor subunit [Burkholderiaceae bacterium]
MNALVHRPRSWLRLLALALLALTLGAGGWWAWKAWGSAPKGDEYIFATVQRGDIEDLVGATGALQPRDYVDVGAQVSGQLKKLHVEVGTEVKEGQLLAEIDAEQSAARVDANRASLRAQQATLIERQVNVEKAERDLQRQRNLMAEEATTTEQVQNADTSVRAARTQVNTLRAQIEQQQASMRVEEANLKFTKIYAPMSGTVISITARQGQTLNTNQSAPTLMRIADLSTMTVQTQVGEADVSKLRGGMSSYFTTLGSPGRRFYGSLRKIEPTPTVTNNVVLYNALFDVPNPNKILMPQMTAQVFFVAAEARDVLVVPVSALTIQRTAAPRARPAATAGAIEAEAPSPAPGTADVPAKSRRGEAGDRPRGAGRRDAAGSTAPAEPRPAKVKVATAEGAVIERDVLVGVSSRVSAEIVSGLSEGERIVVGVKVPDAPKRTAAPVKGPTTGIGAPGGGFGGPR